MGITYSLEIGQNEDDLRKSNNSANEEFDCDDDPDQISSKDITYDFIVNRFPLSENIIKDKEHFLGYTFILPCKQEDAKNFANSKISEKELFDMINKNPNETFDSLFLCGAKIDEEYRNLGLVTKSIMMQIDKYLEKYEISSLCSWAFTKEGKSLANKISKITGIKLLERKDNFD